MVLMEIYNREESKRVERREHKGKKKKDRKKRET